MIYRMQDYDRSMPAGIRANEERWEDAYFSYLSKRPRRLSEAEDIAYTNAAPPCPPDVVQWNMATEYRKAWSLVARMWRQALTMKRGDERSNLDTDDFTIWRGVKLTLAVLLHRQWDDEKQERWRDRNMFLTFEGTPYRPHYVPGYTLIYFDIRGGYTDWSHQYLELKPGLHYQFGSDGETSY